MWRVGTVLGLAYIAAIVLKHTVFRNYMKLRQAEEQKNEKEISRFRRWFRDVGDVYAHNLTALYQFPAVWAATNVAFIADRFAPKLAASDNGAVRKLLENYYFFMGKSYDRTPINGKVWVAGSVVLGGIDTVCVYIQYMYTNEEVAHLIADVFP